MITWWGGYIGEFFDYKSTLTGVRYAGEQGENERQWKKKKKKKKTNKSICNITSIKRVSRKIHVVVVQQQRQRNVKELFFG